MPSKILYLSYDGLTDPLGQSQILPYLCGLSNEYSITIISFEKKGRFSKEQKLIADICTHHNITWIPKIYHKNPVVLSTIYDLFNLYLQAIALHRQQNFKIVHCRSYLTSLVGLNMKLKYKIKFVFDMRGFWADERIEGGIWNLKNPLFKIIYHFFKKKEKEFISAADVVISLTENAKQEIRSWHLNEKIKVIPCCVDLSLFDLEKISITQQQTLRSELGINADEYVLLYLGSLGTWYLTQEMLDFFSALKKSKPNARFLILTPDKPNLHNYQYSNDIIIRNCNRDSVPLFISLAHAAVIFIKPVFSKKASSATKMAEVMAMNIPIITNTGWGDISIFEDTLPGIISVSSSNDYQNAVKRITDANFSGAIRKGILPVFSLARGISLYRSVYQDLM